MWPERRDDNVPARLERSPNRLDVSGALQGVAEEVKHGAIMPEVVGTFVQTGLRHIGTNPLHPRRPLTKAGPC
jgi:hypothetical protein